MPEPPPATSQQLEQLLEVALSLYHLGGPVSCHGRSYAADDWHGGVLQELNQVENMQAELFAAAQKEWGIDNAAGVRALLRLSTAAAVAATLRFALGALDPTAPAATAADVLDEILLTRWWL